MKRLLVFIVYLNLVLYSNINYSSQISEITVSNNSDSYHISATTNSENLSDSVRTIPHNNRPNIIPDQEDFIYLTTNCFSDKKQSALTQIIDAIHLNNEKKFKKNLLKISNYSEQDSFGYTIFDYLAMHKNKHLEKILYKHTNRPAR